MSYTECLNLKNSCHAYLTSKISGLVCEPPPQQISDKPTSHHANGQPGFIHVNWKEAKLAASCIWGITPFVHVPGTSA